MYVQYTENSTKIIAVYFEKMIYRIFDYVAEQMYESINDIAISETEME